MRYLSPSRATLADGVVGWVVGWAGSAPAYGMDGCARGGSVDGSAVEVEEAGAGLGEGLEVHALRVAPGCLDDAWTSPRWTRQTTSGWRRPRRASGTDAGERPEGGPPGRSPGCRAPRRRSAPAPAGRPCRLRANPPGRGPSHVPDAPCHPPRRHPVLRAQRAPLRERHTHPPTKHPRRVGPHSPSPVARDRSERGGIGGPAPRRRGRRGAHERC